MMSGVRLSWLGSLNFNVSSDPAITSSISSAGALAFRYAATCAAVTFCPCSQISAMSSSWTKPQGPVGQLLPALLIAIAAGFVPPSGKAATKSAKCPGLVTLSGLIGDCRMLRAHDEQGGIVNTLVFQGLNH